MSISYTKTGQIRLEGACPMEDAERLLRALLDQPEAPIDWADCHSAHTAVIQVLLAARRPMLGPPAGESLKLWIAPTLARP